MNLRAALLALLALGAPALPANALPLFDFTMRISPVAALPEGMEEALLGEGTPGCGWVLCRQIRVTSNHATQRIHAFSVEAFALSATTLEGWSANRGAFPLVRSNWFFPAIGFDTSNPVFPAGAAIPAGGSADGFFFASFGDLPLYPPPSRRDPKVAFAYSPDAFFDFYQPIGSDFYKRAICQGSLHPEADGVYAGGCNVTEDIPEPGTLGLSVLALPALVRGRRSRSVD